MIITFKELYNTKEDLTKHSLSTPFETAALVANIICSYSKENKNISGSSLVNHILKEQLLKTIILRVKIHLKLK